MRNDNEMKYPLFICTRTMGKKLKGNINVRDITEKRFITDFTKEFNEIFLAFI